MCCCLFMKHKQLQAQQQGHMRAGTSMYDILLSVGWQYACCRQFIFLTNALLIGCSMAIIAAGIEQERSNVGKLLGSSWYQTVMVLGGSLMLTTLLGCTGACYQSKPTLILYIIVLIILILLQGGVIFVASSSELDRVLETNWDGLDDNLKNDIAAEFDCDPSIASVCVEAIRNEARSVQRLIIFVCGGTMLYQIIMCVGTIAYLHGLHGKQKHLKQIQANHGLTGNKKVVISPSDGMEELDSNQYKNIKHRAHN